MVDLTSCAFEHYALPTISFVGGETQDLAFHTHFYVGNKPFPLNGCTANFAIIDYIGRMDPACAPILSREMKIIPGPDGETQNTLTITLSPSETVNLAGKYIYQISVRDIGGDAEIPKQGVLLITNNIDKGFLTG